MQIHPNAAVQAKAQVGLECFVGENTNIAEKTTIKNCIIGSNCKIYEKVRLTNCVIMNNVTIKSLNNINGSIIGDDVETCQKCELTDCVVSKGHHFNDEGGILFFHKIKKCIGRSLASVFTLRHLTVSYIF